jgi:hypothetical protein
MLGGNESEHIFSCNFNKIIIEDLTLKLKRMSKRSQGTSAARAR